ncbi:MAG: hypothetical protein K2O94_07240 [Clostridiales bacterium]|nr:hypothetical protein [Clostridiales bacterium]
MENNELYYEVIATTTDEVQAAYEYAVANNKRYYRAKTKSGKIFGWIGGKHVIAEDGQEWFDNPHYKAPAAEFEEDLDTADNVENEVADKAADTEGVKEAESMPEKENAIINNRATDEQDTPVGAVAAPIIATDTENRIAELERLIAEKTEQLGISENKIRELRNAVKIIKAFIDEV